MTREEEYVKNTFILLIGKFATQFSSFLLIPLFTHYLNTSDYGWVDLLQTYITLFVPILTLRMDSAIFRFLIDKRNNNQESCILISTSILLTILMSIITFCICFVLGLFIKINYFSYVIINILVLMLSNVFLQILRGLGKNSEYSFACCITAILNLSINIILIIFFNYGANSILISSTISNFFVLIFIIFTTKIIKKIRISNFSLEKCKELLKYSLPMIPNALSWWVINASDRTLISIFLGSAFNGIYTVSCKFSNLVNSVFSVFNISWQETASMHINDKDKDTFFTLMINELFFLFSSISIIIVAVLPILYNFLVGKNYISSYNYIPILLYANAFNIFISLIGGIYIALKRTKEIAITTIASALINIVIDLILIRHIGLYAACLSSLLAYLIMSIYRYYDIQKYVKFKINKYRFIILTITYIFSSCIYYINNIYLNIINLLIILIICYILNKNIVKKCINTFLRKIFKKN